MFPILNQEDLRIKLPMEKQIFDEIENQRLEMIISLKNNPGIFRNYDSQELN